ncbi:hypothetical protein [Comamonas thiooxydans]|uniref:hypothetical protein n=1 Tax=Comamonas thiooxydans TaxID=363952 RepID=UPI0002D7F0A1|nr:hypothetical protein [Comamonas thiooxydans]MDO1473277.1 hypothetical protein [Comamonas thiooxydans]UUE93544.1 hypothetical protein MJ608_21970 [Comamonas thiooxydans]
MGDTVAQHHLGRISGRLTMNQNHSDAAQYEIDLSPAGQLPDWKAELDVERMCADTWHRQSSAATP